MNPFHLYQLLTLNLIKKSNGEPLKSRTQPGNWSYVKALPLLLIEKSYTQERLDEELLEAVSEALKDDEERLRKRLAEAPKKPEKLQAISYGFRRNPDVVAFVLNRANVNCVVWMPHFARPKMVIHT